MLPPRRCGVSKLAPLSSDPDPGPEGMAVEACIWQGLRLDAEGQPAILSVLLRRDAAVEEQLLWAQQSDKKASEFMSNVHMRSGQALNKAGQPPPARSSTDCACSPGSLALVRPCQRFKLLHEVLLVLSGSGPGQLMCSWG